MLNDIICVALHAFHVHFAYFCHVQLQQFSKV